MFHVITYCVMHLDGNGCLIYNNFFRSIVNLCISIDFVVIHIRLL